MDGLDIDIGMAVEDIIRSVDEMGVIGSGEGMLHPGQLQTFPRDIQDLPYLLVALLQTVHNPTLQISLF